MQNADSSIYSLFNLAGQVAIVTGSARGIGLAIARGLAQAGVSVVLADILEDELKQAAESINEQGHRALAVPTDLCKLDDLAALDEQTIKEFGRLDILVNCAAINMEASTEECSEENWKLNFDVNVNAAFRLGKLAAKHMIAQKSGSIINIASIMGVLVGTRNPGYNASKGALMQLTRSMACDWAKYNIRVNNIVPSYFKSPMAIKSWSDPQKHDQRASMCLLRRWGEPEELVGPVIFLASQASSFITGNDLFVDGGLVKTGISDNLFAISTKSVNRRQP